MKNKKIIALIVGLLCVALTLIGVFKAINDPFYNLPFFKLLMEESDIQQHSAQLEQALETFESASDEQIAAWEETYSVSYDAMVDYCKNPSITNVVGLGTLDGFIEQEVADICRIFLYVVIGYGAFVALFSLLGALLKKMAFPIIAIIFSIGFYLAFVNILFFVLFLVLSIAHAVLIKKPKQVVMQ